MSEYPVQDSAPARDRTEPGEEGVSPHPVLSCPRLVKAIQSFLADSTDLGGGGLDWPVVQNFPAFEPQLAKLSSLQLALKARNSSSVQNKLRYERNRSIQVGPTLNSKRSQSVSLQRWGFMF